MKKTEKQKKNMSEILSKIVTDIINETEGPQDALSVLSKSIYCILKFAEIEIDDELEETFRHIFGKEYIKEQIKKIQIDQQIE